MVSKDGAEFNKSANIKPGEEVTFRLAIRNTGDVALTNATIKDTLPAGLTLVSGSVTLRANESTTEDALSDNILGTGYNLGTIGTGNVVYITYKAKAGDDFDCAGSELTNKATLTYDSETTTGDTKTDESSVIVKKEDGCEPEEPPLDDCEINPGKEGCSEKNCVTNPEMEECQELPNTGPLEIVMAVVVIAGIGGGGYYLYRTKRTLKTVEGVAKGDGGVGPTSEAVTDEPSTTETPVEESSVEEPKDETPETPTEE